MSEFSDNEKMERMAKDTASLRKLNEALNRPPHYVTINQLTAASLQGLLSAGMLGAGFTEEAIANVAVRIARLTALEIDKQLSA